MNDKPSVTLLHEFLQARGLPPPSYTFVEIPAEGEILCTVRAAGEKVTVVSTSKKLAKRESSNIMLAKLKVIPETHNQTKISPTFSNKCPTPIQDIAKIMDEKPSTAILHELLKARGLAAASYTFEEIQDGRILCTIEAACEKAKVISTSKKSAKLEACNIILSKLQTVPCKQAKLPQVASNSPISDLHLTNEKRSPVVLTDSLQARNFSYTYENISDGLIKCTVQAANEKGVGISTSKELAKEEAFNIILAKFKMMAETRTMQKVSPQAIVKTPLPKSLSNSLMNLNAECKTNEKPYTSLLQEFLQAKKLPLPSCTFKEIPGDNFHCTVQAAGKSATGIAISKKQARQNASKILLDKLQAVPIIPQVKNAKECKATGSKVPGNQLDNYVGELNVYASKRKLSLPVYDTLESTLKSGEYIVNCSFMGEQALGKGKSKKEAKQESAKNMLKLYVCDDNDDKTSVVSNNGNTSKKQKNKQGKDAALDDKLTKDIQTRIVNTVANLKVAQKKANNTVKSNSNPKMQIVINL